MDFIKTAISGVYIIKPKIFHDDRGYFFESYNENEFIKNGINVKFVQDNQSKSSYGVVRGLHQQLGKHSQAKLVRAVKGAVLDVAVDTRKGSPTFGQYVAVELSDENQLQLFIPRYLAHGFSVLTDEVIVAYKTDNFYNKESEYGIRYDDPDINVNWRIPKDKIIVSEKDRNANTFKDFVQRTR